MMTIEECYQRMGGDYAQVLHRLPSADLVKKFIAKFLEDGSFAELEVAMERGSRAEAFRAAHTLKGVSANLGLERLRRSASELTELLRPESEAVPPEAMLMLQQVRWDYRLTADSIRMFLE
ncbi:MAG: Hpt domain-containing protein [Faecousia sp.]